MDSLEGEVSRRDGFTLIEMSIVLIIIGLIVGGIVVGQNLIKAAEVRATITQVEKYNTAANTFRDKYGELPGDMDFNTATQFGFLAAGRGSPGTGDGNGIIQGVNYGGAVSGFNQIGETDMFWVDLSTAHLIDGTFNLVSPTGSPSASSNIGYIYPPAKIGNGNNIYVYSYSGTNYYGLSAITGIGGIICSNPAVTVQQAYSIDAKTDDGLPQSGRVTATYINYDVYSNRIVTPTWAIGGGPYGGCGSTYNEGASTFYNGPGAGTTDNPSNAATPGSSITCYDNGNVGGANQQYSVEINNGTGTNCALSFRFQ